MIRVPRCRELDKGSKVSPKLRGPLHPHPHPHSRYGAGAAGAGAVPCAQRVAWGLFVLESQTWKLWNVTGQGVGRDGLWGLGRNRLDLCAFDFVPWRCVSGPHRAPAVPRVHCPQLTLESASLSSPACGLRPLVQGRTEWSGNPGRWGFPGPGIGFQLGGSGSVPVPPLGSQCESCLRHSGLSGSSCFCFYLPHPSVPPAAPKSLPALCAPWEGDRGLGLPGTGPHPLTHTWGITGEPRGHGPALVLTGRGKILGGDP